MSDSREMSPASTHSSNKLKQILSGHRRRRASNVASDRDSVISDSSSSHLGFRHTVETAFEKFKGEGHYDDGADHGIKKLVPQRIKSKHRKKKLDKEEEERVWQEAARGRLIAERGTIHNDDDDSRSYKVGDDDVSSLMTYEESDNESLPATQPALVSHPSHTGYLTTSSPLVQATTIPLEGLSGRQSPPLKQQHTATLDILTSNSGSNLKVHVDTSRKRSLSPVDKVREALTRITSDKSGSAGTNTKHTSKSGLGVQLQTEGLAAAQSRRGSVSTRLGNIFPSRQTVSQPGPLSEPKSAGQSTRSLQSITTDHHLSTPIGKAAPVIVNTPPTPVEHGTPRFPDPRTRGASDPATPLQSDIVTSASGNMISHRRVRTNSVSLKPSKLSNITSAPLTPTLEQTTATPAQSGFFSSVFSAAQNAANSLSSTIGATSTAQKDRDTRSRSLNSESKHIEDVEVESVGDGLQTGQHMGEKEPAVRTMGMGDLSLSHLGISETPAASAPASPSFAAEAPERGRPEIKEEPSAGIQRARTTSVMLDNHETLAEAFHIPRPRSLLGSTGDRTPPRGSLIEGQSGLTRSGSVRSAVAGVRRKRNSSAATGTTIGAATVVASPVAGSGAPKLTGFAVASKKRNRDFHALFRSVPDDDYLIEDYSCALQREILAHGRLYVSEGHLCFSSNIFGWVTTLVMSFDEIVSVEKRSTALLFKNGLEISTLHAKNVFASFTSRDSTYDLIVGIWKLGQPSLRSSLNGVRIEETGGGDRTEKDDGIGSDAGSLSEDDSEEEDDDIYDEDDDEENGSTSFTAAEGSVTGSEVGDKVAASRKPSAAVDTSKSTTTIDKSKTAALASGATPDYLGPTTHAPTECQDQDTHYDRVIGDDIIPAPVGQVYNLIFGPASGNVMSKWLTGEQKCTDLQWEDRKALDNEHKTRSYSYIKPLNGAIGPKQTKCLTTEVLDYFDLDKAVSLTLTTQTPDVPSGNVFCTKTKYCLSWAEGNATRLQANCTIEWSGKSWLKGPIEKGANDGMIQYTKDLSAMLRSAVSSRGRAATGSSLAAGGKKGKKGRKNGAKSTKSPTSSMSAATKPADGWGLFEPIRPILEPITSIFSPFISGNMASGIIVVLLFTAWFFGFGRSGGSGGDTLNLETPQRIAAYEEMWRREESELWEWLEARVGIDRLNNPRPVVAKVGHAKSLEEKMRENNLSQREVEEAIRVTEEKLRTLKDAVGKDRGKSGKVTEEEGERAAGATH